MADISGAWVPKTDEEVQFIMQVNSIAATAYESGVPQDDIVGGLAFLAATISMQEPNEDALEDLPDPSEHRRETCPDCGEDISEVESFIGGQCIVSPCGCHVNLEQVEGWVDTPGDADA